MGIFAKYCYPDNGGRLERLYISEKLNINNYYLIDQIDVGTSYTSVRLTNFNDNFNSVFFDFYNSDGEKN